MKKLLYIVPLLLILVSCNATKETADKANNETEMTKERIEQRDKQLREMGVDFVAFGTEPDWILRIDYVKKTADVEIMGKGSFTYSLESLEEIDFHHFAVSQGDQMLEISSNEVACWNLMSGERFPYKVELTVNGETYRGCGKSLKDNEEVHIVPARLNDIWVLESFGEEVPDWTDVKGEHPRMEIHLQDMTVHGTTGCNNYQGKIIIDEDKMKIGPLGMTRRFCEGSLENQYVKTLDQVRSYELNGMKLLLKDEAGKVILKFKKVD
jgi:heat shock protein HslJ/uncharacterized membrane protein